VSTFVILLLLFVLVVLGTLPGARFRRTGASGGITYLVIFCGQLALVGGALFIQTLGLPGSWQALGNLTMFAAIPVVAVTALIATPIVLALVPEEDDWV
jgi:hypothetical protein